MHLGHDNKTHLGPLYEWIVPRLVGRVKRHLTADSHVKARVIVTKGALEDNSVTKCCDCHGMLTSQRSTRMLDTNTASSHDNTIRAHVLTCGLQELPLEDRVRTGSVETLVRTDDGAHFLLIH